MIIKGQERKSYAVIGYLVVALIFLSVCYFKFERYDIITSGVIFENLDIHCDAENVEGEFFTNDGYSFIGGATQSDEMALSGKYSSKLDSINKYGFTYVLNHPRQGSKYKVSVWSKNPHPVDAYLVASARNENDFYKITHKTVERNGDFWDRRELSFTVPKNKSLPEIKIYVYKSDGPNAIYFDDLIITELRPDSLALNTDVFDPKVFNLILDDVALDYFKEMKEKSIAQGTVFNDGSKAKARILHQGQSKNLDIRLKGDWLDHIGKYSSYRLDMDSDHNWEGLQSFSVQEPRTRGFLREWVFFKFLDYADILHPRYDFIWYKENNKKPIIFSYEEHFSKNLIEHSNRREGPILKLTEDRMWDVTRRKVKLFSGSLPVIEEKDKAYWASEIRAFKEKKILKSPGLKDNFELAQNLMYQFKFNLQPLDKIFDIDRLAKYLVLVDICLAHHAITWHNQRFYYNPVTSLLEPIGFDAFTPEDPKSYASKILSAYHYKKGGIPYEPMEQLFYDETFIDSYFKYLNEFSQPELITNILNNLEEGINERERFIHNRFPSYKYDREEILKKAKKIRMAMPAFDKSLMAFREETIGGKSTIKLHNSHEFPLRVFAGKKGDKSIVVYPQHSYESVSYVEFVIPKELSQLNFQVVGIDSIHTVDIVDWPTPQNKVPRQELTSNNLSDFQDILSFDNSNVVFKKGRHVISSPLVIGKGKYVLIKSGTELQFINNAFLLSYSAVNLMGDPDEPILIKSQDGDCGSFSVLQASEKSILRHVVFDNQNTLQYKKWNLTGAVNFYESDVDIVHVTFRSNNCEDALNIIRSEFVLEKSIFSNTFGDAFDSDFCTGQINNCRFVNSGNDAIDVSGSNISVKNTTIEKAGDKGISGGEQSTVLANMVNIKDANIGVASKDFSVVTVNGMDITRCKTGFTAFQKKPEFGPSKIVLNKVKLEDVLHDYMIEENSVLIINN